MRLIIFNDFVQEKTFTETSWGPLAYQFVPHEHILSLLDPNQRGSCPKLCLLSIRDDARTVTRWRPTWCRHQQKSSGIVLQLLRLRSDKCKKSDCLRMIHSLNCLPCQDNAWCEYVWFVWFVSQIVLRTNFDCWFGCNAELAKGGWLILTHLRFHRNPDWFENNGPKNTNTNINKNTNRFENNGAASRPPLPSGFRLALNQTDSRKKKT